MKDSPIGRPRTAPEPMETVLVKLPRSIADTVRRRASAEDRAMSAYLRRMIIARIEHEQLETVR
jgi:hypothetical protein